MKVYITAVSSFLPGSPVDNDNIDRYLGEVSSISARTRQIILRNNGIRTRYYALDPQTGESTYSNAELTAEAVRRLFPERGSYAAITDCLCCGTSTPDQLLPGHGSMVQGELRVGPCEVVTTAGVCLTGTTALKYGFMSVAAGMSSNAIVTGSELASTFMNQRFFSAMAGAASKGNTKKHQAFSFEADFLRWMLSDGAGAILLAPEPVDEKLNLRIDWIEITSHGHRLDACMYAGGKKNKDGGIKGWRDCILSGTSLEKSGLMTIKQDARLLNEEIINVTVSESLPPIIEKHSLSAESITWFLPHYSSHYFREPLRKRLEEIGFPIDEKNWFTNLTSKGNTGSASFFIMLEELYHSGRLKKGDRILGMVPESGRFSVGWILLTVV